MISDQKKRRDEQENKMTFRTGEGATAVVVGSALGEQCLFALVLGFARCVGYEVLCESMVRPARKIARDHDLPRHVLRFLCVDVSAGPRHEGATTGDDEEEQAKEKEKENGTRPPSPKGPVRQLGLEEVLEGGERKSSWDSTRTALVWVNDEAFPPPLRRAIQARLVRDLPEGVLVVVYKDPVDAPWRQEALPIVDTVDVELSWSSQRRLSLLSRKGRRGGGAGDTGTGLRMNGAAAAQSWRGEEEWRAARAKAARPRRCSRHDI